ncbi:MAG: tRNA pseudouridine(13) synthase TruD [Candidatus Micrarchaeia archaeon]
MESIGNKRLSTKQRARGTIKAGPEDFVVEEITQTGFLLESGEKYGNEHAKMIDANASENGKFAVFVMEKRNWNTMQALREIAKRCNKGAKSVGFAGTKDRIALTTQLCSVFGADSNFIKGIHIKDIAINGAWKSDSGIKLGDLLGNRFTIRIKGIEGYENIGEINSELGGIFPNYYGPQRFGTRSNNVEIGLHILKQEFKLAAMEYLTGASGETDEESVEARTRLSKEWDFEEALHYFPKRMKYERLMLSRLAKTHDDYSGALRSLPRQMLLLFVHAVESYIFNKALEYRIENGIKGALEGEKVCGSDALGFPDLSNVFSARGSKKGSSDDNGESSGRTFPLGRVIGFDTKKEELSPYESVILDELGITPESFKVRKLPGLASKGTLRPIFAPYLGFNAAREGEDAVLRFLLPSGSYATVLINEFVETKSV